MDIKNENDSKKENKLQGHQKGKGGKIKKVEGKKPVPVGVAVDNLPDARGRAKSTLVNPFDVKKLITTKKESKPVETIGSDRFNLLKSMFEKKAEPVSKEEPKKFEPKKFSVFLPNQSNQPKEEKKIDPILTKPTGISDSIKKRMEDLMNSNKRSSVQPKIDPVLEQRKLIRDMEECDNEDEDEDNQEDLGISEDEGISDKDEGLSEAEEEKVKEKKVEKNDLIEEKDEKDDSFEDKKEVEKVQEEKKETVEDAIDYRKNLKNEVNVENVVETENKFNSENEVTIKINNKDDD